MDKLDCIKVFTQVARQGSFTAVANEMNMTQSAVSKKVAWLESTLGFSLFHRTSRKISLTTSGEQYLDYSLKFLEEMLHTEQKLKNELNEAIGELRLSAPSAFASQKLAKPVAKFMQLNPKITVNMSVSDRQIDLYKDNIDIAIRASVLNDSGLKAKKLMEHELCYFVSSNYLSRCEKPLTLDNLHEHNCITYSLSNPSNIWHLNSQKYNVKEVATSDNPELIVQLALEGVGIAAMPNWMVKRHFKSGHLVEVFEDTEKFSLPMYAVYKSVELLPYRIRAFIDFLSNYFKA